VADPQLRLLLSQINAFRLSWPAPLRRPTQVPSNQFDADLIAAHMMTHGATIALGEPLVTKEHWTNDIARVALSAVRAILSLLYDSECNPQPSRVELALTCPQSLPRAMMVSITSTRRLPVSVNPR
jgi:hypothetical protein